MVGCGATATLYHSPMVAQRGPTPAAFARIPEKPKLPVMTSADTTVPLRWLELLSSRLCHDLISPVSAIGNGVELIEEMGADMLDDALSLIGDSARRASGRLAVFRVALGAAGGQAGLDPNDVIQAVTGAFKGGKVTLAIQPEVASWLGTRKGGAGKVLAGLVLVAEETVPFGGQVAVDINDQDRLVIRAQGRRAGFEHGNDLALAGDLPESELGPRTVLSAVVARLASAYGFEIEAQSEADVITLTVTANGS